MAVRDSQDVELTITQPTTAQVRDSQDITLAIIEPSPTIRNSQDVLLLITQFPPSTGDQTVFFLIT